MLLYNILDVLKDSMEIWKHFALYHCCKL